MIDNVVIYNIAHKVTQTNDWRDDCHLPQLLDCCQTLKDYYETDKIRS